MPVTGENVAHSVLAALEPDVESCFPVLDWQMGQVWAQLLEVGEA